MKNVKLHRVRGEVFI